jgi:predicted outer membrane repeat protein
MEPTRHTPTCISMKTILPLPPAVAPAGRRALLLGALGLAGAAHAQITADGQLDAAYGPPLAVQANPTGYGDNTNADPLAANGSELDAAHAVIRDGKLHVLLTGNLETNFNKLNVFIDSEAGGQNTLANDNPDVDFNGLNNLAGLKFDTGFEADHFLTIGGGGDPIEFFANYAELGNPGTGIFLGGTGSPNAGFPVTLASGVEIGVDNSNTGGVTAVNGTGHGVTTGIEFSIPLALIGNPTGPVKVCAFITNPGRTDVSNQVLGGLETGTANLGAPSAVDFSALPGNQFFPVTYQVTNNANSGAGSLRQTIIDAPAGSSITFDPALAGQTITLGGSAMAINKALTISGFDLRPGITLDANQASRVFHVSSTGSLTLQGLTLTGGNGVGSPASGFGGAILTQGTLFASHCLFIGNSADLDGGAISGNCDLVNCTFTENSAERNGSAVVMGNGSLHHCTVTNNQSDPSTGAVYCFFAFGSGGVVTIANCIVAENSPNDIWGQGGGQIVFAGQNIAASTGSPLAPLPFTGPAPLTDSPALALLGNYGGPTLSCPPVPGSPAIDAALPAAIQPIDDQRGAIRSSGVSDIGAVEYQGTSDLATFWNTDWDGDGKSFGVEFATASDPITADNGAPGDFTAPILNPGGDRILSFGVNPDAIGLVIWEIEYSPDLSPGSWVSVVRGDEPDNLNRLELETNFSAQPNAGDPPTVTITDANPPADRGFYRFAALLPGP